MNIPGDGEDHPKLAPPTVPGVPMAAPVAADVLRARTADPYPRYSSVPAQTADASAGVLGDLHPAAGTPPVIPGAAGAPRAPQARTEADAAPEGVPPTAHETVVGRGGPDFAPEPPAHTDYLVTGRPPGEPPEDPNRVIVRKQLDALRLRAANASSWREASARYAQLVNRDGVVPVSTRFTRDDLEFLGRARDEVLGFAELGLRLLDLHAPLDAGGISTDPSSPILRCRSCMWRWPCPTFHVLGEAISRLPHPGAPPAC